MAIFTNGATNQNIGGGFATSSAVKDLPEVNPGIIASNNSDENIGLGCCSIATSASQVSFNPTGSIVSNTVQSAIAELDSDVTVLKGLVPDAVTIIYIDPATQQATINQALPVGPSDGDIAEYHFGGQIGYGNVVVTTFNFTGGTVLAGLPAAFSSGDSLSLRYRAANSTWYLK